MTQRANYMQQAPELFKKYAEFSGMTRKGGIEESIRTLVTARASQMNGCAYCLDMHVKEAHLQGERPLRLYHLPVWRESTLFTPRERAALAWTEVLTNIPEHGVSDDIYAEVSAEFNDKELSELTYVVMAINGWNRINVAFRTQPGISDKAFGLDKANLA